MTNTVSNSRLFSLFWENSKLNKRTAITLAKKFDDDSRTARNLPQLIYPTEDLILEKPSDILAQIMLDRKSTREFSSDPITDKQLGSLFYGFSQNGNRRLIPSAGGKYPIEVFAFLFNVTGKLKNSVVYYNSDTHSLSKISSCPSWEQCKQSFSFEPEGTPACFFVFVTIPERTIDKYGERGGRFILIESGQYAQNLGLRVAQEKLAGVLIGGMHDDEVKALLGLQKSNVLVTLGYACGNPKV